MSLETIAFVVFVAGALISQGAQMYIHFEAYPLLAAVGKNEFAAYLKKYEGALAIPLLLPYALTVLSNVALLFVRTERLSLVGLVGALALNLAVTAVTLALVRPVYARITQAGQAAGADMAPLMRLNLLRLALTTASTLVTLYLLVTLLPA